MAPSSDLPRSDTPAVPGAARRWASRLAALAIPRTILAAAPRPPWFYPPDVFRSEARPERTVPEAGPEPADTPSTGLARAALPAEGGTALDVGCGAGRAGLALAPPAARVIGVDRDAGMLNVFQAAAAARGVEWLAVQGDWPAVAGRVEDADVVVCHHVAYNVSDLAGFGLALNARARRRVVLELGQEHPMAYLAPLWRQFWGLERPAGPTAGDAVAVLREVGLPALQVSWFEAPGGSRVGSLPPERQVEITRIRLCLPAERDPEIAAALRALGPPVPREMVTVWWDRSGDPTTRS